MVSVPRSASNSQPHEPNIQVQLTQARERIKTLETENRALKQQMAWEDKLFANQHLSPAHKLALRATVARLRKKDQTDKLTKIYIPSIAEAIGLSPKTTGKSLKFLADTGAIIREAETETDQSGQKITRVYIGLTDQVKKPETIQPSKPRNHGGLRSYCPACGSENLLEEKKIICTDCGTVISHLQKLVNPNPADRQDDCRSSEEEAVPPMDNLSLLKNHQEPMDNLTNGSPPCPQEPATPPEQAAACSLSTAVILSPPAMKEQVQPEQETRELEEAAQLLLDLAGDYPEHIVMNDHPDCPKKYVTIKRALTPEDVRQHVQGKKSVGGRLTHIDGTTRALCFDVDDNPTDSVTWQDLQASAGILIASGYKPLLEPSPAGRGGHLWLIFTERVNAEAAYHKVCEVAPQLKDITEYWPATNNQKVRLPAGKYVTPANSTWTTLYDATGRVLTKTGTPAAILLSHQTPAELIPTVVPTIEPDPEETWKQSAKQLCEAAMTTPDEKHKAKYGEHAMWVAWPSEQYLIDHFNETHSIDDLAIFDRSGMINASHIGRPERTASVGVTEDGQHFTDFGAGARKPDGSQDGGDPFEFYIRSRHLNKSEMLRELGQALNKEASQEILRAGRAGELLPMWVLKIITDTGRAIYNENAMKHDHLTLEEQEHDGGVGGFSTSEETEEQQEEVEQVESEINNNMDAKHASLLEEGDYPPSQRPCIKCNVVAWKWIGDRYICGNPGHPLD